MTDQQQTSQLADTLGTQLPPHRHTLKVLDDNTEDMILLTYQSGDLITYDDQGNIRAIDDAQTQLANYLRMAKEQGIAVDEKLIVRW